VRQDVRGPRPGRPDILKGYGIDMSDVLLAVGGLYLVILLRAGATYALGRGAGAGIRRSKLGARIPVAKLRRAEQAIARWGAPVVALSFLTVGFQTAANFVAGSLKLPLVRYLPALFVGGLAWAIIYATVGIGVLEIILFTLRNHPGAWWIVVLVVLAIAALITWRVRRSRASEARADIAGDAQRDTLDNESEIGDPQLNP